MNLRIKNSYLKFPKKKFGVHPVFPRLSVGDSVQHNTPHQAQKCRHLCNQSHAAIFASISGGLYPASEPRAEETTQFVQRNPICSYLTLVWGFEELVSPNCKCDMTMTQFHHFAPQHLVRPCRGDSAVCHTKLVLPTL